MQRLTETFYVKDIPGFKSKMLNWMQQFSIFCLLDSNNYNIKHARYDCLVAVKAVDIFQPQTNILSNLHSFYERTSDWLFGHFNYELKEETENVYDNLPKHRVAFPKAFFFQPETVIHLAGNTVTLSTLVSSAKNLFSEIDNMHYEVITNTYSFNFKSAFSKSEYIKTVEQLQQHIHKGDCYEINFCQEFFAENAVINAVNLFAQLNKISPVPFSAFYRINDQYLCCASPERFIAKRKNKLLSQPIKGTAARSKNSITDKQVLNNLKQSIKDRTENVMIVDLVRNDLSRICNKGSVTAEEMFEVYSFEQVHQMISTITGKVNENINLSDVLQATFPMGSMTGAPKKRVMELIAQYEKTQRGIFSGTVGYISPNKDFDFNVVIRSVMYDESKKLLSYMVGSAITALSNAEDEYEECLLKAKAIRQILEQPQRVPEGADCESIN